MKNDSKAIINGSWKKYLHIKGLFIRKQMDTYCEELFRAFVGNET